jgi:hypothetical protein
MAHTKVFVLVVDLVDLSVHFSKNVIPEIVLLLGSIRDAEFRQMLSKSLLESNIIIRYSLVADNS